MPRFFGVHISRHPARRSIAEHCRHLGRLGFVPTTVIDVGVAGRTPGLYDHFEAANLLLIEPLREYESSLRRLCRAPNAKYVLAAAGPEPGEVEINVYDRALSSSSCLVDPRGVGSKRRVLVTTVDLECRRASFLGPYLMKLDIQGFELEVLRGAGEVLRDTEVVIMEVSLFRFFTTNPIFSDVVVFMKEKGFEVYDILGAHLRPLDQALAQVDMVFARANGVLRRSDHFA